MYKFQACLIVIFSIYIANSFLSYGLGPVTIQGGEFKINATEDFQPVGCVYFRFGESNLTAAGLTINNNTEPNFPTGKYSYFEFNDNAVYDSATSSWYLNVGNLFAPNGNFLGVPSYNDMATEINQDLEAMAAQHYNTVRVYIDGTYHIRNFPPGDVNDYWAFVITPASTNQTVTTYLNKQVVQNICSFINLAESKGLFVELSMGLVGASYEIITDSYSTPLNYIKESPSDPDPPCVCIEGFNNYMMNPSMVEAQYFYLKHLLLKMTEIDPTVFNSVLGLELINEPAFYRSGPFNIDKGTLTVPHLNNQSFNMKDDLTATQNIGRQRLCDESTLYWANALISAIDPYPVHIVSPSLYTNYGAGSMLGVQRTETFYTGLAAALQEGRQPLRAKIFNEHLDIDYISIQPYPIISYSTNPSILGTKVNSTAQTIESFPVESLAPIAASQSKAFPLLSDFDLDHLYMQYSPVADFNSIELDFSDFGNPQIAGAPINKPIVITETGVGYAEIPHPKAAADYYKRFRALTTGYGFDGWIWFPWDHQFSGPLGLWDADITGESVEIREELAPGAGFTPAIPAGWKLTANSSKDYLSSSTSMDAFDPDPGNNSLPNLNTIWRSSYSTGEAWVEVGLLGFYNLSSLVLAWDSDEKVPKGLEIQVSLDGNNPTTVMSQYNIIGNKTYILFKENTVGNFVRIVCKNPDTAYRRFSIKDCSIYAANPHRLANISSLADPSTGITANNTNPFYPKTHIIDGNRLTGEWRSTLNPSGNVNLALDLTKGYPVKAIDLLWTQVPGEYEIQVADDLDNFQQLWGASAGDADGFVTLVRRTPMATGYYHDYFHLPSGSFCPRYLRIVCKDLASGSNYYGLREASVIGDPQPIIDLVEGKPLTKVSAYPNGSSVVFQNQQTSNLTDNNHATIDAWVDSGGYILDTIVYNVDQPSPPSNQNATAEVHGFYAHVFTDPVHTGIPYTKLSFDFAATFNKDMSPGLQVPVVNSEGLHYELDSMQSPPYIYAMMNFPRYPAIADSLGLSIFAYTQTNGIYHATYEYPYYYQLMEIGIYGRDTQYFDAASGKIAFVNVFPYINGLMTDEYPDTTGWGAVIGSPNPTITLNIQDAQNPTDRHVRAIEIEWLAPSRSYILYRKLNGVWDSGMNFTNANRWYIPTREYREVNFMATDVSIVCTEAAFNFTKISNIRVWVED